MQKYLMDCEGEYMHPDQEYRNKDTMPEIYLEHVTKVSRLEEDYLFFDIYRVDVKPPRIYINSSSKAYDLIREISLPNISYLAILKLRDENEETIYEFFDHRNIIVNINYNKRLNMMCTTSIDGFLNVYILPNKLCR